MRPHTHLTVTALACAIVTLPAAVFGQTLSIGVVGGAGLTGDFRNYFTPGFPGGPGSTEYSTPKRYFGGAMIEAGFPGHFSLELDGLYRPLGYTFAGVEPDGSLNSVSPAAVVTWEFPVLAKYRFSWGRLTPFVEAGPSLRTTGNLNGANPSHYGITGGAGFEMHLWGLNVAPTLRYTRWRADSRQFVQTTPDQIELLVGISRASPSIWRPLGQRFALGVIAGTNLTGYFRPGNFSYVDVGSGTSVTTLSFPGPASLLAGPMIEAEFAKGFSLEADALHQPLHTTYRATVDGRREPDQVSSSIEWNFPVLAKYRRPMRLATPFLELGPSFRLPQGVFGASHYGVTAGLGAEVHLRRLRIAPAFRYTHWGPRDPQAFNGEARNRVEFLTGFSF